MAPFFIPFFHSEDTVFVWRGALSERDIGAKLRNVEF
jgi:hypothetical protein